MQRSLSLERKDAKLPVILKKIKLSPRKPNPNLKRMTFPAMAGSSSKGVGPAKGAMTFPYRYRILPGNNSRLIMNTMKRRPWWNPLLGAEEAEDENSPAPSMIWEMNRNSQRYKSNRFDKTLLNHLEKDLCLVSKKGLYYTLKSWCEEKGDDSDMLKLVPRTFYLQSSLAGSSSVINDDKDSFIAFNRAAYASRQQSGESSPPHAGNEEYTSATSAAPVGSPPKAAPGKEGGSFGGNISPSKREKREKKKLATKAATENALPPPTDGEDGLIWIMKPASFTNRGFGIKVVRGEKGVFDLINKRAVSACKSSKSSNGNSASSFSNATSGTLAAAAAGSKNNGQSGKLSAFQAAAASVIAAEASAEVKDGAASVDGDAKDDASATAAAIRIAAEQEAKDAKELEEVENSNQKLTRQARRLAAQDGWIVQEYMERPLLLAGRKFDIRCYVLVTLDLKKGGMKGYFYHDAYIRTSGKKFTLKNLSDRETHLTNDAVQQGTKSYGKFEEGNKMSLQEWQEAINRDYPGSPTDVVFGRIWPEVKRLTHISLAAAESHLKNTRAPRSFELFGYDYMVDQDFVPYLIEVNTNPCLEFSAPMLEPLLTNLLENTFRIAVDSHFPPPPAATRTKSTSDAADAIEQGEQKFELFFP